MDKIKRKLSGKIRDHLAKKEITLIVGARQVGKTTLMKALQKELESKSQKTVFLNLDYEEDKKFFVSQDSLINKLELEFGTKKGVVFIDEIQKKEDAGIFLKGIYDMNLPYKLIVSGSGSLELKEKIHESLAGRKRMFELMPINFDEFVDYKTEYRYETRLQNFFELEKEKTINLLKEYLNFGGYPRVITEVEFSEKKAVISEIFKSYIEKDITVLLKVARVDAFNMMIKLLASQLGNLVNYSNLAKSTGISLASLKNYLWYAEKTFVINLVQPYFTNYKKEIIKSPVVYFSDLGLRNYSLGIFGKIEEQIEFGFLFQNFIFNLLRSKYEDQSPIKFWRTQEKAEVDFILQNGKEIIPIEVKFKRLKKMEITRSMRNFIERYNPKEAWIINLDYQGDVIIGNTKVKILPFWELI